MPIIINAIDINWHETQEKIRIIIPLASRVDVKPSIFITSKYLKLSSPPYLWECFLFCPISVEDSFVRITNENVSFELQKTVPGIWGNLTEIEAGTEKESYRKVKRNEALEEHQKYLEKFVETKLKKQQEIKSSSVKKQMELDNEERTSIERIKQEEKEKFLAALKRKEDQIKANEIAEKRKCIQKKIMEVPELRKTGVIKVNFTPRVFPTAARESQEADEQEWLEKQLAARVSLKLDLDDLSPEERNPDWLKSKAESMFRKGDFQSAINAFGLAIRLCPDLYSLYSRRAMCNLKLRNLHKAVEDSTKAIELLTPPTKSNADARVEALKIRGMAFQMLELPVEGLIEFEAALKINPLDEELKSKIKILREYIQKPTE